MVEKAFELFKGRKGELQAKVDKLGQLKDEIDAKEREMKELKAELMEQAKKQEAHKLEGNSYVVEYVDEEKTTVDPDDLRRKLAEMGFEDRFIRLVKPSVQKARKVLGEANFEDVAQVELKPYAKTLIKRKGE